jgi:GGDEF domain-containing protein
MGLLDRVYRCLKNDPPDHAGAMALLKEMLRKEPCQSEVQAAREVAILLLERLVKPITRQDRDQDGSIELLTRHIRQAPRLHVDAIAARLVALPVWMGEQAELLATIREMPPAFLDRLLEALRLLGAGEPWLLDAVEALEQERRAWRSRLPSSPDTSGGTIPWESLYAMLGRVVASRERARDVWHEERRELLHTLRVVAERMEEAMQQVGRVDGEMGTIVQRLRDDQHTVDLESLRTVLVCEAQAFLGHAQAMSRQVEESRALLAKARERLHQADDEVRELRDQQLLDPVTGLPTRFALWGHLRRLIERASHLQEPFTLLLLRLERLSAVLATLGTEQKKRLLVALIKRLRPVLSEEAILTHVDDEDFAILLPNGRTEDGYREIGRVREVMDQIRGDLGGRSLAIQPAFGVVEFDAGKANGAPVTGVDERQLLDMAIASLAADVAADVTERRALPSGN